MPAREFPLTHSVRAPYGDFWSATVPDRRHAARRAGLGVGHARPLRLPLHDRQPERRHARLDHRSVCPRVRRRQAVGLHARATSPTPGVRARHSGAHRRWPTSSSTKSTSPSSAATSTAPANSWPTSPISASTPSRSCRSPTSATRSTGAICRSAISASTSASASARISRQLVDIGHQHGIAVIVDVVYGHTGVDFPYYDAYTRLQYRENPFMGPFAKDYFSNFGKSTDFNRQTDARLFLHGQPPLARGVPRRRLSLRLRAELLGRPAGRRLRQPGLRNLPARQGEDRAGRARTGAASMRGRASRSRWFRWPSSSRTRRGPAHHLLQQHLAERHLRRGARGRTRRPRSARRPRPALGLFGYPEQETANGDVIPKAALQYIENHDHERFLCNFGTTIPTRPATRCSRRATAAAGTCCSPT